MLNSTSKPGVPVEEPLYPCSKFFGLKKTVSEFSFARIMIMYTLGSEVFPSALDSSESALLMVGKSAPSISVTSLVGGVSAIDRSAKRMQKMMEVESIKRMSRVP